jgi:threonine dehydrogenase-like Zn-dependent dehydrogenase
MPSGGRGLDKCIDAVGMEAHAGGSFDAVKKAKATMMLATDRAHALREAIMACRPAGVVSVPSIYSGMLDKVPFGAAMNNGGQTHVNRYTEDLLHRIEEGEIDPGFVITRRAGLAGGPEMYKTFRDKEDGCIEVGLTA